MIHGKYWSNTHVADLIRGTDKPLAETLEGWKEWEQTAKQKHPVRFWISENAFDAIQDVICYIPSKIRSVINYLNNRFVNRRHLLSGAPDLQPGAFHEYGDQIFPCLFNGLVDFVEIDLACMAVFFDTEAQRRYNVPWWRLSGLFKKWRNPEAGIEYLNWASALVYNEDWGIDKTNPKYGMPTTQAIAAKETLELYNWYKQVYKNRIDPYDVIYTNKDADKVADGNTLDYVKRTSIEATYEQEDTEMLIRLIKIRSSFWT